MKRLFSLFALSLFLSLAALAQHICVVVVPQPVLRTYYPGSYVSGYGTVSPDVRTYYPGTYVSDYGFVPPVAVDEPMVDPVVVSTPVVVTPVIAMPTLGAPVIVVRWPNVITRNRR
jgi:hypothetical protein